MKQCSTSLCWWWCWSYTAPYTASFYSGWGIRRKRKQCIWNKCSLCQLLQLTWEMLGKTSSLTSNELSRVSLNLCMITYEDNIYLLASKVQFAALLLCLHTEPWHLHQDKNKQAPSHLVICLTWLDVIVANFKASAAAAITYGSLPQCSAPPCPQLVSHQPWGDRAPRTQFQPFCSLSCLAETSPTSAEVTRKVEQQRAPQRRACPRANGFRVGPHTVFPHPFCRGFGV